MSPSRYRIRLTWVLVTSAIFAAVSTLDLVSGTSNLRPAAYAGFAVAALFATNGIIMLVRKDRPRS